MPEYPLDWIGPVLFAPGFIDEVWNLAALKAGLIFGIPTEELLFGFTFGLYWAGVYEHFTWTESVAYGRRAASKVASPPSLEVASIESSLKL